MKPIYWMLLIWGVLFFLVFLPEKRRKTAAAAHHIKRKGKKEREAMETLAKQFAGKECIIYTITSHSNYFSISLPSFYYTYFMFWRNSSIN